MIYKLKAPAKINLSLDVVSKRPDGYHNLKSIMHTVPLYDELEVTENNDGALRIISNKPSMCPTKKNIIYKVYTAFYDALNMTPKGFDVKLKKNIPDSAGLAGGSSDGAEFLKFLNRYHNNPLSENELISVGAKKGADIPFLIKGGCCLCEGIGEMLTPLPTLSGIEILIAKPSSGGLSTPEIFSALKIEEITRRPNTELIIKALENKNPRELPANMYNVLEEISVKYCPIISDLEKIMIDSGALISIMSGSGNAVFGIFDGSAKHATDNLKKINEELFIFDIRL